jgi:hypothetical protein
MYFTKATTCSLTFERGTVALHAGCAGGDMDTYEQYYTSVNYFWDRKALERQNWWRNLTALSL